MYQSKTVKRWGWVLTATSHCPCTRVVWAEQSFPMTPGMASVIACGQFRRFFNQERISSSGVLLFPIWGRMTTSSAESFLEFHVFIVLCPTSFHGTKMIRSLRASHIEEDSLFYISAVFLITPFPVHPLLKAALIVLFLSSSMGSEKFSYHSSSFGFIMILFFLRI